FIAFKGWLADCNRICRKHVAHPFSGGAAAGRRRLDLGFGTHRYLSSFGKKALVRGSHSDVSSSWEGKQEPGADDVGFRGGSFAGPSAFASGPLAFTVAMVSRQPGTCPHNSLPAASSAGSGSKWRSRRFSSAPLRWAWRSISRTGRFIRL